MAYMIIPNNSKCHEETITGLNLSQLEWLVNNIKKSYML